MNDHKEHISHYSAADIQRYVQGKLSAAEMHAMEKAALDDPFLADAIEGMQQAFSEHEENLVTGQLQQLQQQFQTRTAGKGKVVAFKPFRYWQASAAAVIVIVAGVWIYSLVNRNASKNNTQIIAQTQKKETQQQAPEPSLADGNETLSTDSLTPPKDVTAKTSQWYRNKERVKTNKPAATGAPDAPATLAQPSSNSIAQKDVPAESPRQALDDAKKYYAQSEKKEAVARNNMETAPAAAAAAPEPVKPQRNENEADKWAEREAETELITIAKTENKYKKAPVKDKNLSGVIKGQVTDAFNNPVANAYVQLQKNNNNNFINNFITDKKGFFKIPVSDSVVNVAVNVSGYGTQNFTLQNNTGMNQLQLQPANYNNAFNNNMSNNWPSAAANNKKQLSANYKFPNVTLYDAEPAYGWVAFGQYLEKSKIIPPGTENISGNVVLSFEVNKRGELSDYKIEQSLSKAHDEEAIRLIKQGPSWKLRNGRKARVTVMVRF